MAIKVPLNKQKRIATTQATRTPARISGTEIFPARRIFTNTEPAIAAQAPTEIS